MDISVTFLYTIVNFLILYVLLRKFLFKPISEYMESRRLHIESQLKEAKEAKEEAEKINAKYRGQMRSAKNEAQEILDRASRQGEDMREDIAKQAKEESDRIIERARREIELEKARAIEELKEHVVSLSLMAATSVIEEKAGERAHAEMVEKFIREAGETN